MSMMLCANCQRLVNTDDDPESLYVVEMKCICWGCRENYPSLDDHLKACAGIMPEKKT